MASDWYVRILGHELGPMSDNQLRELVAKRRLSVDDEVRKGVAGKWVSAIKVGGLFERPKSPVPQPAPQRSLRSRIGFWTLSMLGGLFLLTALMIFVADPSQWLVAVLTSIFAFCMFPIGWKWLYSRYAVANRFGVKTRWVVGSVAFLAIPHIDPDEHNPRASRPAVVQQAINYSIIESESLAGNRRRLVVRLNDRISEAEIRQLASEIRDVSNDGRNLAHIAFYLPDMIVGTGAWATAEFNPDLKVRMIGLTVEQEQAIRSQPIAPSREVIGTWWDERPLVKNKMTYYRENGKVYLENKFDDGSARVIEMLEIKSATGLRYTKKPDDGDYYIIDASGNLEWWDEDGHFMTSRRAN